MTNPRQRPTVAELGGGYAVAGRYRKSLDGIDLPYSGVMETAFEAGRMVCTKLELEQREGGPPITSDGLRQVPIAALLREMTPLPMRATGDGGFEPIDATDPDELAAYVRARKRAEKAGRRRITDEDLQMVASVYREALAGGRPPAAEVQLRLRLGTPEQARRWISKARQAGVLGPAPGPRVVGEVSSEKRGDR